MAKIFGQQIKLANESYVDNSALINVPNTTITGRAQIQDPSKDLSVNMGINRIMVQQIYQIQNEFGSNGEPVWAALNDVAGQIRFVGTFSNVIDNDGQYVTNLSTTDFIEITFYGTGLNFINRMTTASQDMRASVDGGAEGANIFGGATFNSVLSSRNYSTNQVISVANGLSVGVHTVKLRNNQTSQNQKIYGFEVVNDSSSIRTNSGSAYSAGASAVLAAQDVSSYNSGFTNVYGTAGTRGGHVLVYVASDGSIKKDIQYTNTAQANLTSADHTNEEVVRVHHWREFGANRSDDFSTLAFGGSGTNAYFTLDDGVTSLSGASVRTSNPTGSQTQQSLQLPVNGASFTFTFVGTGCDIIRSDDQNGGSDTYSVSVDGTSLGNLNSTGQQAPRREKIVSGLPYGSHTLTITRVSVATYTSGVNQFIVYQPKKPALPTGAVELADYNILANYSFNSTNAANDVSNSSIGVIKKGASREFTYVGSSWSVTSGSGRYDGATLTDNSVSGSYFEYTFFGTGLELRTTIASSRSNNISVTLNGLAATTANFAGITANVGANGSFNTSTGVMSLNSGSTVNGGVGFSGLTLGRYTVRFTNNTSSALLVDTLDIITPIYSAKPNFQADLQNTLMVGSRSISDNRKFVSSLNGQAATKYRGVAQGATANPTTSSTSLVPCPELSLTVPSKGAWFRVTYSVSMSSAGSNSSYNQIFVDGVGVGTMRLGGNASTAFFTNSDSELVYLSPGVHKIDTYWQGDGGTVTGTSNRRSMMVEEL